MFDFSKVPDKGKDAFMRMLGASQEAIDAKRQARGLPVVSQGGGGGFEKLRPAIEAARDQAMTRMGDKFANKGGNVRVPPQASMFNRVGPSPSAMPSPAPADNAAMVASALMPQRQTAGMNNSPFIRRPF